MILETAQTYVSNTADSPKIGLYFHINALLIKLHDFLKVSSLNLDRAVFIFSVLQLQQYNTLLIVHSKATFITGIVMK